MFCVFLMSVVKRCSISAELAGKQLFEDFWFIRKTTGGSNTINCFKKKFLINKEALKSFNGKSYAQFEDL